MYYTFDRENHLYRSGLEFEERRLGIGEFGLGFDVSSNDYKVVRIHHLTYDEVEVWVYSLKSNSWTRFDDVTFDVEARKSCLIFVQCVDRLTNFPIIVARFDFASNKFQLLPFRYSREHLYVLEGQVCLGLGNKNEYDQYEYKHERDEHEVRLLGVADEYDDPVQIRRELDTIKSMFSEHDIVWYDLKKKTFENYEIGGVSHYWKNSVSCWETLLQLNSSSKMELIKTL
ncbi:uncharacterized protein LOC126668212 [Mercurialis annua]|uniref:uncharacterized protein LOC126668212 n=1 Tax=Mercurialis annua TaxID=3986 RepID=UPI00216035B7|nr:uncharacterized protein LOC126668212 [Mercurialis annua]